MLTCRGNYSFFVKAIESRLAKPRTTPFDFNTLTYEQKRAYLSIVIKVADAVYGKRWGNVDSNRKNSLNV